MSKFLKTALCAAIFAGLCDSAKAIELPSPLEETVTHISHQVETNISSQTHRDNKTKVKFGIARLDKGRLIALPFGEEEDWIFLDRRINASFEPISIRGYLNNVPEIPMYGRDTDNKLDEIRLTAQDQNLDYVIVYGVDKLKQNAPIAEARMIDTYSGVELGMVTAERDEIEFNIGLLTDRVGEMVKLYTDPKA